MRYIQPVIVFFLLTVCTGCSTNPVTGKNQFSIVSQSQEIAIGRKNYGPYQQQQGGVYSVDKKLSVYVSSVGQKLARVSDNTQLPYEFVVLNNDVPNAWALPGGKIAINRGLLILLDDEAQLAAVLGHEIVHAAARHGAAQMTQSALLGMGANAAGALSQGNEYGQLIAMGANIGASAWQARYGRGQELESDRYGMEYMQRAGYEPLAAVELQETFVTLSKGQSNDFLSTLFASHPPSAERVASNRARAANMPKGVRNRKAYQAAIAQIKKDAPAYEANAKALQLMVKKDYKQALAFTQKAIKQQPNEALFYITKGELLLQMKQDKGAIAAFTQSIQKNPNYFLAYVSKGLLEKKLGALNRAKVSLEKSLELLPTQTATFHLGELAVKSGNKDDAVRYFTYAAKGGGEMGQAAAQKLAELQPVSEQITR